jgi:DNA-binding response OmpR family regulator
MALPLEKTSRLGEILIRRKAITQTDLEHGLLAQATHVMPIGSTLIHLGMIDEREVSLALAEQYGVPAVDLGASTISTEVLTVIPQEVAASHVILPLAFEGQSLQVALANPHQTSLLDEVAFACGKQTLPFVGPKILLQNAIKGAHEAKAKGARAWRGPRSKHEEPHIEMLQAVAQPSKSISIEQELPEGPIGYGTPASMHRPRTEGGPPRVLAVDDEVEILDLIEKAVSRSGIEVVRATRGREALDMLRATTPDVVLLDAMLPEIHGFEICMKIKQSPQYRHIPVIIISAIYTGWNFVQDVKRVYGADDYLAKPFRVVELVRRVEEALARTKGRPKSPEVQHAQNEAARACSLAAEHFRLGQVEESVECAQRAVEADPFDPRAHFILGTGLHRLGRIYEAISEYERVVELAPTYFTALKNVAVLYERQGFKAKAVEMWMRAVAQSPNDAVRQTIKAHLIGLL